MCVLKCVTAVCCGIIKIVLKVKFLNYSFSFSYHEPVAGLLLVFLFNNFVKQTEEVSNVLFVSLDHN